MTDYNKKLKEIEEHQDSIISKIKSKLPDNFDIIKINDDILIKQEINRKSDLAEIKNNINRNDLINQFKELE